MAIRSSVLVKNVAGKVSMGPPPPPTLARVCCAATNGGASDTRAVQLAPCELTCLACGVCSLVEASECLRER